MSFNCIQCGAPLTIPPEAQAMSVHCPYCKRENPLPAHILAHRQQQLRDQQQAEIRLQAMKHHQQVVKTSSRMGLWITLGSMGLVALIVGLSLFLSFRSSSPRYVQMPVETPAMPVPPPRVKTVEPPAPAKPEKPPVDPKIAQDKMTALMKSKVGAGCSHVVMAPKRMAGNSSFTATMTKGPCLTIMTVSSEDTAKIGMTIKTPVGEEVKGPTPSNEVTFSLCATMPGPHVVQVEPDTTDFYMLSAVDCPPGVAKAAPKKK